MRHDDIARALPALGYPSGWTLAGDSLAGLTWADPGSAPTLTDQDIIHGLALADATKRRGPVQAEAEALIAAGILVNGRPFRADEASRQRLGEMITRFDAGQASTVTFVTADGQRFSWSSAVHAKAIADAIAGYMMAVLAASADRQADPVNGPPWPTRPEITVPN